MEIKVLGIHASPRNGATAAALKYGLSAASEFAEVETDYVELRKQNLHYCLHCDLCIAKDTFNCPAIKDGMEEIYAKVVETDVLILASPVYQMGIAPMMSMFMSRLRPLGKLTSRGGWALKVGCGIAVGGHRNGGEETTLDTINRFFLAQGTCIAGGGVYSYNGGTVWSKDLKDKGALADQIGLDTITMSVRRAVVTAKLLKLGKENYQDLTPEQLAGFKDKEDRDIQVATFFNQA